MDKIGVFCSGCEPMHPLHVEAACRLGEWIGRTKRTLVYGGANLGLMECVARAVKENGGTVIGVVPSKLEERGGVSDLLDRVCHTQNLSDRKDVILDESDILVALPGGVGTLDEIFHVIASYTIGYHSKRVILYNVDGFWDSLVEMIALMEQQGLVRPATSNAYVVADSLESVISVIDNK